MVKFIIKWAFIAVLIIVSTAIILSLALSYNASMKEAIFIGLMNALTNFVIVLFTKIL